MYYTSTTYSPTFYTVKQGTDKTPFLPLFRSVSAQIREGKVLTPSGNRYSKNTAKNYQTDIKVLSLFEEETEPIFLESISIKWAEDFSIWMMEREYCKNTIAGTLQRIKAVLHRLKDEGKCTFDGSGIKARPEEVTTVFNTIEELKTLLDTELPPGLAKVRDIYVLHCFLGLRYSDLAVILANPHNFIREMGAKRYFEIKTQKTGEVVFIPISRTVKQVLEMYDYDFGNIFSYQYYNEAIKTVARKAGITDKIVFSRTKGGKRIDYTIEKCDLMSSHTARRTFATNAHLSGLSEKDIMMITGHKTTASFYRYIRTNSLQSAIKIANHNFFNIELPVTLSLPL